jgi:hypothetical protein
MPFEYESLTAFSFLYDIKRTSLVQLVAGIQYRSATGKWPQTAFWEITPGDFVRSTAPSLFS